VVRVPFTQTLPQISSFYLSLHTGFLSPEVVLFTLHTPAFPLVRALPFLSHFALRVRPTLFFSGSLPKHGLVVFFLNSTVFLMVRRHLSPLYIPISPGGMVLSRSLTFLPLAFPPFKSLGDPFLTRTKSLRGTRFSYPHARSFPRPSVFFSRCPSSVLC